MAPLGNQCGFAYVCEVGSARRRSNVILGERNLRVETDIRNDLMRTFRT